jgi:hypothetical protein
LTDIQETENHITISQSSARISCGQEPEGAGTVGTKPGNCGKKKKTFILTSEHKNGRRRQKIKSNLTNWMGSHYLLSLSQKVCNI